VRLVPSWSLVLALLACAAGCGTSGADRRQSAEIQGKPPTPETDPFFYVARPPESAKADTKGTIGEPEKTDKGVGDDKKSAPDKSADVEKAAVDAEALRNRLMLAEASRDEVEAKLLEAEARNRALAAEVASAKEASSAAATKKAEASAPPGEQCFSCVKICPATGRCPDDAEIVCGWGTAKDRKNAMLRATTECDAALDIVRGGAQWSRVDGRCPVATCQ